MTQTASLDGANEKDPKHAAKAAHLRYVTDRSPGIRRERTESGGFLYFKPDGTKIEDEETIIRINSLAIPPAYRDVWICPLPYGHLQATGRDERGRKQYRYHSRWRQVRDETKYTRMIAFGQALPTIRERVKRDLARPGLPREKVLATLARLLETTLIRVGNEEYARENKSFGLTTMQVNHVDIEGSKIHFAFRGKSGKSHEIDLRDRKLARIVERCKDFPGKEVFQYADESGNLHSVQSEDVNQYIHEIAGTAFTAKDFRTWAGTVLATVALCGLEPCTEKKQIKHNVVAAVQQAAEHLGNTPAVCRKSYIHPDVITCYEDGRLKGLVGELSSGDDNDSGLRPEEVAVLRFLKARIQSEELGHQG